MLPHLSPSRCTLPVKPAGGDLPAGLTVIVNVFAGPSHVTEPFSKCGVTTIVATIGAVPAFIAVNDAISPVPPAASPIDGSSFVQVYVTVPTVFFVVNVTTLSPSHCTVSVKPPGGDLPPD